jgi:hypothetical protein
MRINLRKVIFEGRRKTRERGFSDVVSKPRVQPLFLREKSLKIEIKKSSFVNFFRDNRRSASLIVVSLLLIGGATVFVLVRGSDIEDFYPVSCLGNVENIQNMIGRTDFAEKSDQNVLTAENSASVPSGNAQIYCGNFKTYDSSQEELMSKKIRKITLLLSWSFSFPNGSTTPVLNPTSSPAGDSGSAASSADIPASSSVPVTIPIPPPPLSPDVPIASTSLPDVLPAPVIPSVASTTPPAEPATTTVGEAPLGGFFGIVATAQARAAPTLEELATAEKLTATSSVPTLNIPFDLPSISEPLTQDIYSVGNYFEVSYSTDGRHWSLLGTVVDFAYPVSSFVLPIGSWSDVQSLQIRILGSISQENPPTVMIDGMSLKVETGNESRNGSVFSNAPAEPEAPILPPPAGEVIPQKETIFDDNAKHFCRVTPFLNSVSADSSVSFEVDLTPSSSSTNPFTVSVGDLPLGLKGSITASTTPFISVVKIDASADVLAGSYSLLLLYNEIKHDGQVSATACQYNLVVQ